MPSAIVTAEQFRDAGNWSSSGSHELFWIEAGENDDSPPVLFLHGIPSWSWLWREVLPVTATLRRSIAVDLPGFGLSEKSDDIDFRIPALAEALEAFIDAEVGPGRPVSLVVHDFGALVGAELIARSPERFSELVMTNTSLRAQAWLGGGPLRVLGIPFAGELAMWLARPWMLQMAMRPFVAYPDARRGERFAGYWYPFEHGFGRTLAKLYQQRPVRQEDFARWRSALTGYTGRVLILWGARDPAFTVDEVDDLLALMPTAETMTFPGASHFLPEDAPKSLGRRIRSFLAEVPVDRS